MPAPAETGGRDINTENLNRKIREKYLSKAEIQRSRYNGSQAATEAK